MSTLDASRHCILSTSNLHCHWDSSSVSLLIRICFKSSFVSPIIRGEAGSQYSFPHFFFIYANSYLTPHLTATVCFAYPCLLCCIWRFSSVNLGPSESHVRIKLLALLYSSMHVKSDSYNLSKNCPTRSVGAGECWRPCGALVHVVVFLGWQAVWSVFRGASSDTYLVCTSMGLAHRRLTPDFTSYMFLAEAWIASAVIYACTTFGLYFFPGVHSSAPEWLKPVLWPRTTTTWYTLQTQQGD